MKQVYTGRQRVEAAFKAERTDRIPFTTAIVDNKAFLEFLGLTPKEYYLDLDKALQASTKAQEMFPSDMIWVAGDPLTKVAILAWAEAKYGPGVHLPPPLKEKTALASMTVRDPKQHRSYVNYLGMCQKFSSLFKDTWMEALAPGI